MTPHKKSKWLEGGDACLECSEDWPCRDMRIWQSGYRAGLEEARLVLGKLSASDQADVFNVQDMLDWLDAKLKEQP